MSDKELFTRLEEEWMAACGRKDVQAIDRYLASDFMATVVASNGELVTRSAWIDYVCKASATTRVHDVTVRRHGDMAVVNLMMDFSGDWNSEFLMTDVWLKDGDDWKVMHRHNSYPATAYTLRS